jgi:hypothetical protein
MNLRLSVTQRCQGVKSVNVIMSYLIPQLSYFCISKNFFDFLPKSVTLCHSVTHVMCVKV